MGVKHFGTDGAQCSKSEKLSNKKCEYLWLLGATPFKKMLILAFASALVFATIGRSLAGQLIRGQLIEVQLIGVN